MLAALVVAACGPGMGDVVSTGGGDESTGDGELESTTEMADDTGPATGPDGTEGTEGTGEPEQSWCLRGTAQSALDSSYVLQAVDDMDGDGRDEVWMTEALWDPIAELQSTRVRAFEMGDEGQLELLVDLEYEGTAIAMADIDGDGRLDVLMTQWDEPDAWWLAGLPDLSFDEVAQSLEPLSAEEFHGRWIDGNGDGMVDLIRGTETGLALHLGDGAGTFTLTDTHDFVTEFGTLKVWPSDVPGVLLSSFEEVVLGFGDFIQEFNALSVSPGGEITILASATVDAIGVKLVRDIDGDGVPEALGHDEVSYQSMTYLRQGEPGEYVAELIEEPIFGVAADTLISADEVDVLHWTNVDGEMWLRRHVGDGWPNAVPVTVEGPWFRAGVITTLQVDGQGGRELLHLSHQGRNSSYSLWRLESCE